MYITVHQWRLQLTTKSMLSLNINILVGYVPTFDQMVDIMHIVRSYSIHSQTFNQIDLKYQNSAKH